MQKKRKKSCELLNRSKFSFYTHTLKEREGERKKNKTKQWNGYRNTHKKNKKQPNKTKQNKTRWRSLLDVTTTKFLNMGKAKHVISDFCSCYCCCFCRICCFVAFFLRRRHIHCSSFLSSFQFLFVYNDIVLLALRHRTRDLRFVVSLWCAYFMSQGVLDARTDKMSHKTHDTDDVDDGQPQDEKKPSFAILYGQKMEFLQYKSTQHNTHTIHATRRTTQYDGIMLCHKKEGDSAPCQSLLF